MRSDAANFATAQEQHYNREDQYMSVVQASGTAAGNTGNFRLSEDVGITISGVTQNGYTAVFRHRKWLARSCTLIVTNTTGSRVTCATSTATPVPAFAGTEQVN